MSKAFSGPKPGDRPGAEKNFKGAKGGRPKGSHDTFSRTAKENVIAVFDKVGGIDAMATWAKKNRTEFYKLYARLIPVDVNVKDKREAADLTDSELAEIIARAGSAGTVGEEEGEGVAPNVH